MGFIRPNVKRLPSVLPFPMVAIDNDTFYGVLFILIKELALEIEMHYNLLHTHIPVQYMQISQTMQYCIVSETTQMPHQPPAKPLTATFHVSLYAEMCS